MTDPALERLRSDPRRTAALVATLERVARERAASLPKRARAMLATRGRPLPRELGAYALRLPLRHRSRLVEVLEYRLRAARLAEALPRVAR